MLQSRPHRAERNAALLGADRSGVGRCGLAFAPGLKDPVAERPNDSDLGTSEFAQNSVRIHKEFSELFRSSEKF